MDQMHTGCSRFLRILAAMSMIVGFYAFLSGCQTYPKTEPTEPNHAVSSSSSPSASATGLLGAPSPSPQSTPGISTPSRIETPVTPSQNPSPTPSLDPGMSDLLNQFPLQVGMVRAFRYSDSYIDKINDEGTPVYIETASYILQKVIDKSFEDGVIAYHTNEWWCPEIESPLSDCELSPISPVYKFRNDTISEHHAVILRWPIEIGDEWQPEEDYDYLIRVLRSRKVSIPFGMFENCVDYSWSTVSSQLDYTFCPGVGFVEFSGKVHAPFPEGWNKVLVDISVE